MGYFSFNQLTRGSTCAVAAVIGLMISTGGADAYQFEDIQGQWCGAKTNKFVTNQIFSRDRLTVVHRNTNETNSFEIIGFDFLPDRIRVNYRRDGRDTSVEYGHFSRDLRSMTQLQTTDGPTYKFSRC